MYCYQSKNVTKTVIVNDVRRSFYNKFCYNYDKRFWIRANVRGNIRTNTNRTSFVLTNEIRTNFITTNGIMPPGQMTIVKMIQ
jgi:hypothetical protein